MESRRLAAQEQSDLENPKVVKFEKNVSSEVAGSAVEDGTSSDSNASSLITDEVLRHRIRTLIDEKPKPSTLHTISTHPLLVVVVGGFIGVLLTHYYTSQQKDLEYNHSIQQQELASQRSFSDEVNKIRVQKLGEVWEQVDKNEIVLSSLLEKAKRLTNSNSQKNENVDVINSLIEEDKVIINRNRFWLGEQNYNELKNYLDKNVQFAVNMLLAPPGTDLNDIIKKREHVKQDILQIRKRMLLESEPSK